MCQKCPLLALPKKSFPTYELTLPSSGEVIKYRPYLTGEQTLILMAMEGDDVNEITNTVKQLVSQCVLTKPFNVDNLTTTDLEYVMLQLRAKSVSNIVNLVYRCKNVLGDGKQCNNEVKCSVNIDDIKVQGEQPDKKIPLYTDENGESGVIMKRPTVGLLNHVPLSSLVTIKGSYKLIALCIDAVYDAEKVYDAKKETPQEVEDFLMSLPVESFKKITDWFEKQPSIFHEFEFSCNKCGYSHKMKLEGLYGFFA